ncbi:MAG: SDR family oxidoreductase [Verrucomicrobiota bacterium]
MDIKGQIAVVTGAGSGLGRALAIELAKRGASVALIGRRADRLQETQSLIEKAGGKSKAWPRDVSISVDVESVIHEIALEWGPIDILINNAAVFPENSTVEEMEISDWDETQATNLRGPFLMCRAVLPSMKDRNYGRILNISAPIKHYPGASGYCSSKSALDSLTKAMAFENKENKIRINAVEPPFLNTEMHTGGPEPETVVDEILEWVSPSEELKSGRIHKIKSSAG